MDNEPEEPEDIAEESLEEDLIRIDAVNKFIDVNESIPIINTVSMREYESMEIIKSTVDILHEQIEFLKEEIREKNLLIKLLNFRNANDGDKININNFSESEHSALVETTSTTESISSKTEDSEASNYNSQCDNDDYINVETHSKDMNLVGYDDSLSDVFNNTRIINEPIEDQFNYYKIN